MKFFDLVTPFGKREVVERLRGSVGTAWLSGDEPVRGRVSDRSFSLRRRIFYRNSFQTNLRGRYVEERNGTRIKCYAGVHPVVIAFMTVWFAVVLFAAVAILPATPSAATSGPSVMVFGMLVFGCVLVAGGRYAARKELAELIAFLEETIDATRAP